MSKDELLGKIGEQEALLRSLLIEYWKQFSGLSSWQFWVIIAMLVIPLIVLYFTIDRNRVFVLGFFGFCVHVITTYVDITGVRLGYWEYPQYVLPYLRLTLGLDTALIPVVFMLLYQWVTARKKNYYLYALILGAIFAFVIKPILSYFDFFRLHQGMNYLTLYLFAYIPIVLLSKWLFNSFVFLDKQKKH